MKWSPINKVFFWIKSLTAGAMVLLSFTLFGKFNFDIAPENIEEGEEVEDPQWGKIPPISGYATVVHGLDKTTARVFSIELVHNEQIAFNTLRIVVRGCKKNPPEEQPEAAAFLEIWEEKPKEAPHHLFSGWMFASSPSLSSLEHPIYDIWITDCRVKNDNQMPVNNQSLQDYK